MQEVLGKVVRAVMYLVKRTDSHSGLAGIPYQRVPLCVLVMLYIGMASDLCTQTYLSLCHLGCNWYHSHLFAVLLGYLTLGYVTAHGKFYHLSDK